MVPKHAQGLIASRQAETTYVRDLRNIARQVAAATVKALAKHLRVPDSPGRVVRMDATGRIAPHSETINILGLKVQTHVRAETGKAFDKMATDVNRKNAKAVASLVPLPREATTSVAPMIDTFRDANIRLMEKAGASYVDQVRQVLEDPENEGLRVEELTTKFKAIADGMGERGDVFGSRAELIARDQTLKLNANLTQQRMKDAGVSRYTWSTSNDERVRPMHAELEGQQFAFNSPPVTDEDGNTNNPGEDYQCRCIAMPVLPNFDDL